MRVLYRDEAQGFRATPAKPHTLMMAGQKTKSHEEEGLSDPQYRVPSLSYLDCLLNFSPRLTKRYEGRGPRQAEFQANFWAFESLTNLGCEVRQDLGLHLPPQSAFSQLESFLQSWLKSAGRQFGKTYLGSLENTFQGGLGPVGEGVIASALRREADGDRASEEPARGRGCSRPFSD